MDSDNFAKCKPKNEKESSDKENSEKHLFTTVQHLEEKDDESALDLSVKKRKPLVDVAHAGKEVTKTESHLSSEDENKITDSNVEEKTDSKSSTYIAEEKSTSQSEELSGNVSEHYLLAKALAESSDSDHELFVSYSPVPPFQESNSVSPLPAENVPSTSRVCVKCHSEFEDVNQIADKLLKEFYHSYRPKKKGEKNVYCCPVCCRIVHKEEDRRGHILNHIQNNEVRCEECLDGTQQLIDEENAKAKSLDYRRETEKVEFEFNTILDASSIIVSCGRCETEFSRGDILLRELAVKEILTPLHEKSGSRRKTRFSCGVCRCQCKNESLMASHLLDHNEKKHFLCVPCQQEVKQRFLYKHKYKVPTLSENSEETVNLNIPSPKQCVMCLNPVVRPDLLAIVMANMIFEKTGIYMCVLCWEDLLNKTDARNHAIFHIRCQDVLYCEDCLNIIMESKRS